MILTEFIEAGFKIPHAYRVCAVVEVDYDHALIITRHTIFMITREPEPLKFSTRVLAHIPAVKEK